MKKAMAAGRDSSRRSRCRCRSPALRFRTYKLSQALRPATSPPSAPRSRIELDGERIAALPRRVRRHGGDAEARARPPKRALVGKPWTEATARAAMAALAHDYTPLTDMRASAAYRLQTAQNLLYRFFLETRPDEPLPAAAGQRVRRRERRPR